MARPGQSCHVERGKVDHSVSGVRPVLQADALERVVGVADRQSHDRLVAAALRKSPERGQTRGMVNTDPHRSRSSRRSRREPRDHASVRSERTRERAATTRRRRRGRRETDRERGRIANRTDRSLDVARHGGLHDRRERAVSIGRDGSRCLPGSQLLTYIGNRLGVIRRPAVSRDTLASSRVSVVSERPSPLNESTPDSHRSPGPQ